MNNLAPKKLEYHSPEIILVQLDNEISLALESTPPTYEKVTNNYPEFFHFNPF